MADESTRAGLPARRQGHRLLQELQVHVAVTVVHDALEARVDLVGGRAAVPAGAAGRTLAGVETGADLVGDGVDVRDVVLRRCVAAGPPRLHIEVGVVRFTPEAGEGRGITGRAGHARQAGLAVAVGGARVLDDRAALAEAGRVDRQRVDHETRGGDAPGRRRALTERRHRGSRFRRWPWRRCRVDEGAAVEHAPCAGASDRIRRTTASAGRARGEVRTAVGPVERRAGGAVESDVPVDLEERCGSRGAYAAPPDAS